ncbi:IclR family transcriptional regulator [Cognatishimia sp. D5M38]|uniref:IclR family transcriptional regulator n=1 Tax=Cognatishimia coralii TaxID=3083254 RepID=A0ABU8QK20_9RHOB|nr:IclR family transcriptional regulator [Sulfitobacter sp. PR48]MDD9722826.1 IclR family transcriptional regulator [Sulfitobacter sp. PR48]
MNKSTDRGIDRKKPPVIPETPTPAIARGAAILDFVAASSTSVTAQMISEGLGLPKSSVHNLCSTLVTLDMLSRRGNQSYVVGPHVMRWSRAFSQRADVATEFAHVLDDSTPVLDAVITLSLREGDEVMLIAVRNAGALVGGGLRIGQRLPLAFSAMGKAFLSHISDARIEQMFEDGFPARPTGLSAQSVKVLIAQVRRCRIEGHATDDQECRDGVRSFASTVLDASNQPVAAVAVSISSDDPDLDRNQEVAAFTRLTAQKISSRLGADLGE